MKKTGMALVAAAAAFLTASAANYTFVPTESDADWSLAANYRDASGNAPAQCPGASDTVTLPAGVGYTIAAPSASFDTLKGFRQIVPNGNKLTFDLTADGTYTLGCAVSAGTGSAKKDYDAGNEIEVTGAGTLVLAADQVVVNGTNFYDYNVNLTVRRGCTMRLSPGTAAVSCFVGRVTVDEGATFYTAARGLGFSGTAFSYLYQLSGAGDLTNEPVPGAGRTGHSMAVRGNGADASYFTGRILSPITLYNQSGAGTLTLAGTNSTFGSTYFGGGSIPVDATHYYPKTDPNGVIMVKTFGDTTKSPYSSLGASNGRLISSSEGNSSVSVLKYIGEGGETCTREISHLGSGKIIVDAGTNGGLRFEGNWNAGYQGTAYHFRIHRLELAGSNETECVIATDLKPQTIVAADRTYAQTKGWADPFPCTTYPWYVIKSGPGVWRLADLTSATGCGGYAVQEGTLRFDSIAERGAPCALGLATVLTDGTFDTLTETAFTPVGYAFALGNPRDASILPVFEFTGSKSAVCSTRPMVLVGGGGELRNSTPNALSFSGVSARDADANPTLYLGGSNASGMGVASSVTNGPSGAKVNVTKVGAGTWTLGDGNGFTGDLAVKEGTLFVNGSAYTWFRFTVKEVPGWEHTRAGNSHYGMSMGQIALYDKDGVRQNVGMTQPFDPVTYPYWNASFQRDPKTIPAGEAEFDCGYGEGAAYFFYGSLMGGQNAYDVTKYPLTYRERLDCLFDDLNKTTGMFLMSYRNEKSFKTGDDTAVPTQRQPKLDNANSWISIVMHLPNDAHEIASYDYCSSDLNEIGRWPVKFVLEGSRDGRNWTVLDDKTGDDTDFATTMAGKTSCWYSDGSAFASGAVRTGFPICGVADAAPVTDLTKVRSVSVAPGATLAAVGSGLEIGAIKLDAKGNGTIRGFAFVAAGEVAVENAEKSGDEVLPVALESCEGVSGLADWTVTSVNGKKTRGYSLSVDKDGQVHLYRRGLMLIVR